MGKPVLKVVISSSDGYTYNVTAQKLIEQMLPVEHVRHFLNYTTKLLHIASRTNKNASEYILNFISIVAALDEINELNISNIVYTELDQQMLGDKEFISTLYFPNVRNRNLTFSFPTKHYEYQFEYSLEALLLYNIQILDKLHLLWLLEAIRYLNKSYENGIDPKSTFSLADLPNDAFEKKERISGPDRIRILDMDN